MEPKQMEEMFADLEGIISKLENGECSLEESFALYEQGVRLVRDCGARLDKVEKQMILLQEEGQENGF